jgi:DNA modification methylase
MYLMILTPEYPTKLHLNALDFLKIFTDNTVDMVLYDPPYSFRQVSECYKKLDLTVTAKDTSNAFFANFKKEIARVVKKDGIVISCGWNSNGIGKKLGFEQQEILLVAHGSNHNDTIVTVERKIE